MDTPEQWIDAGAWVGRQQAFAVIASKCSAAQAVALQQVKQSRSYESLGLTWEQFCRQHAGISRSYADDLIGRLDEFGAAYFRLCEIARISPETYREIAGSVTAETIEIEGESLPLTHANAARIRSALKRLREQLAQARSEKGYRAPNISELVHRVDVLMVETFQAGKQRIDHGDRAALVGLAGYAIDKWKEFQKFIESHPVSLTHTL